MHPPDEIPGPGPSWPAAVVRAFLPTRWGLCALGLGASLLLGVGIAGLRPGDLARDPPEELRRWVEALALDDLVSPGLRSLLLAGLLAGGWALVAAWIARAELLRQRADPGPVRTSAAR